MVYVIIDRDTIEEEVHVYRLIPLANDEEHGFLVQAIQAQLGEAKEVLERHQNEEPPLSDSQTTGEAAEDYSNIVATQMRRVAALERFLEVVK